MTIAVGIEIYAKVEAIVAALWVVILSLQTRILPDVSLMLIFGIVVESLFCLW